jgi:hypothetical protein
LSRTMYVYYQSSNSYTDCKQVKRRHPFIKRPAHYQSVVDGLSRGHVQIVCTTTSSSPPPYIHRQATDSTGRDIEGQAGSNDTQETSSGQQQLGEVWSLPATPPRPIPCRTSTSSPLPRNIILPSKMNIGVEQ